MCKIKDKGNKGLPKKRKEGGGGEGREKGKKEVVEMEGREGERRWRWKGEREGGRDGASKVKEN